MIQDNGFKPCEQCRTICFRLNPPTCDSLKQRLSMSKLDGRRLDLFLRCSALMFLLPRSSTEKPFYLLLP